MGVFWLLRQYRSDAGCVDLRGDFYNRGTHGAEKGRQMNGLILASRYRDSISDDCFFELPGTGPRRAKVIWSAAVRFILF